MTACMPNYFSFKPNITVSIAEAIFSKTQDRYAQ